MATLNGNLGGFKDKKMNCRAGKLISAEHLLLIHSDDCAFCECSHFLVQALVQIFLPENFQHVCKHGFMADGLL